MASLGNHRNMSRAQCSAGGVGRRLPQSATPLTWQADPLIGPLRVYMTGKITDYILAKGAPGPGVYEQRISQVSVDFENRLFLSAPSKEDYLNLETLGQRVRFLIQGKFYGVLPVQPRVAYATPSVLLTSAVQPSMGYLRCNPNSQLLDAVPDSTIAPSTPLNVGGANYFNRSQLLRDVTPQLNGSQANDFTLRKKSTSHITPAGQVTFSAPLLVDGNGIKCDDSNLTYSGSVLHYESESSFDSSRKAQHYVEDLPKIESQRSKQLEYAVNSQLSDGDNHFWILSCYIKYKFDPKTSGLGKDPFLQYVHTNICKNCAKCACEMLKQQLDHIDQCLSPHCSDCSNLLHYHNSGQLRSKRVNSRIHLQQMPFENSALIDRSYVNPEMCRTPSKLRKFSNDVPFSSSSSPKQSQFSEPLLSCNSVDTDLNMETDTPHTQYSASICDSKIASPISGDFVDCVQNEVEPVVNDVLKDKASESLSSPSSKCLATLSEPHQCNALGGTNSGDTDLNMETAAPHTQYSGSICDSKIASRMPGDFVDCIQNEVEPAVNDELKDTAFKSSSSPSSKCLATLSEERQGNDLGGTNVDTELLENTGANRTCSVPVKLKMQGVSLTEFLTPEQLKQHVSSLKQDTDQIVDVQEIGNTTNNRISENFCQLCNKDKLWFQPIPIYCSPCGNRIKWKGTYYSMVDENGVQVSICSACHNRSRGPTKSKMEIKKNDVVTEESWVQCDKCEGWQHQVCALFNDKRDLGGKTEYICPNCYLTELETGDCKPLPWSSCFAASNLPKTILSDHLEHRLFERLEKDKEDRLKAAADNLDEVLGASDLTVRVVSSVNKVLQVKQQFQDIFPDNSYPAEFPYRSKVILLFQRIEGVDVCLFGMYVQEFGSQCRSPNQRCVYISYLDSVKYFRPETKSAAGEALRTFVYHELLIAYLEYCKKRGFSTCYIWACPPVKGEDYILYCHPEVQKTPKPDKLRQWYRSMLKKAAKEQIIVNSSNIYEQFFVHNEGCNTKVTAARLPYFDGDYWSSVSDSMIKKIEKECGGDLQKKVKKMTRRSLKAMGHTDPTITEGDAKDILLMHELGQTLSSAKEDFIIVYLHFICTRCHEVIASGKRWHCSHCKNFQLCESCQSKDPNLESTHVSSTGQKHVLSQEVVDDVPSNTEDNDAIMDNCFLENRHALLSFCQGNRYQFDTLRRAKHSSMMILYHLHHPNGASKLSDTTTTTCSLCLKDVAVNTQWNCNLCPDFIVCAVCYQRNGVGCHTHNLTQNILAPPPDPAVDEKAKMLEEMLDVLLHASICSRCDNPNCYKLKKLFSHSRICKIKPVRECIYCTRIWRLIKIHAQRCSDPNCSVPRCRDVRRASETKPPDTAPDATQ